MKIFKNALLILALSLFLISCAHNPYKNNFVAENDILITVDENNNSIQPKLYLSKDMSKAAIEMRSNGYILVGTCEFENGLVNFEKAIEQAIDINADFVVVQKENTGNYVGYYPKKFNTGIMGRKIPKNKTDFVDIPYLVEKYGYKATFWAKVM